MGNSEVGHLNLGAGTVVKQDLVRIDEAIADGSFFENEALRGACAAARDGRPPAPDRASCPAGGVHSSLEHLRACIELAARERVPELVLHAFTDGRDTLADLVARATSREVEALARAGARRAGRARAHRLGDGPLLGRWTATALGPHEARLRRARARRGPAARAARRTRSSRPTGATRPTSSSSRRSIGEPAAPVRDRRQRADFNFRPGPHAPARARAGRAGLRRVRPRAASPRVHAHDDDALPARTGTTRSPSSRRGPRPRSRAVLAERGERQLHVAETEKYPHVTYFFNGGVEDAVSAARSAAWCPRPATSRPTTTSRR